MAFNFLDGPGRREAARRHQAADWIRPANEIEIGIGCTCDPR
jgi:hypothetical protein